MELGIGNKGENQAAIAEIVGILWIGTDLQMLFGKKHGIKVYRQANGGNHLHLIILRSREAYIGFIRSISGLIARLMLKAERGSPNPTRNQAKFWDKRPFTRIVEWGREFRGVSNYLLQNTLEAIGFIPYRPRRPSVYLRSG